MKEITNAICYCCCHNCASCGFLLVCQSSAVNCATNWKTNKLKLNKYI